jgi:hypothetical protein
MNPLCETPSARTEWQGPGNYGSSGAEANACLPISQFFFNTFSAGKPAAVRASEICLSRLAN